MANDFAMFDKSYVD